MYFRPCYEKEPPVTEGTGEPGADTGDQSAASHQDRQDSGVEGPGCQGAAVPLSSSVASTPPDKSKGSYAPPMEGGPCDKSSPESKTFSVGISPQTGTTSILETETKPMSIDCMQEPEKMPPASLGAGVPVAFGLAAVGSMDCAVPLRKEGRHFSSMVLSVHPTHQGFFH